MPLVLLLWLHFFWCLIPSWEAGGYYTYGWLVAPIALAFAWRRGGEEIVGRVKGFASRDSRVKGFASRGSAIMRGVGEEGEEVIGGQLSVVSGKARSGSALAGQDGQQTTDNEPPTTEHGQPPTANRQPSTALWLLGLYLLLLIPLRLVEIGDPSWRIPILFHALMLVGLTSFVLWRAGGWGLLMWFLPVMVFALTAVPLPWQIEQVLVRTLTGSVTSLTQEVFLLRGMPVERAGETLHLGREAVEVGDACSGIRSLQSLFMAALFFGELLWLGLGRRIALVFLACACALVTNTGRAYWLAETQFSKGEAAAAAIHDMAGHVAFGLSCLVLFLGAKLMTVRRRKVVVRQA